VKLPGKLHELMNYMLELQCISITYCTNFGFQTTLRKAKFINDSYLDEWLNPMVLHIYIYIYIYIYILHTESKLISETMFQIQKL
jgi:hypothetical protein